MTSILVRVASKLTGRHTRHTTTSSPRVALVLFAAAVVLPVHGQTVHVGSKRFTESYILGEIIKQTIDAAGEASATHQRGLGNTAITLAALRAGSIDLYPEYTGTIAKEILKLDTVPSLADLNAKLAPMGLAASFPLGFNNTYALALRGDDARRRGVTRLSDLGAQRDLRFGLSQEFIGRADGWPGLLRAYGWPLPTPRGLDHGLAYAAIANAQVDIVDVYSTDAQIDKLKLTVLADDRGYFPRYDAVLLHRIDLPARLPRTWAALAALENRLDDAAMRRLNAAAEIDGQDFAAIAAGWLAQVGRAPAGGAGAANPPAAAPEQTLPASTPPPASPSPPSPQRFWQRLFAADFGRLAYQHIGLVFWSLAASIALGVPLGVVAARRRRLAGPILGTIGVIQTIPSLALLAILIPLTGRIGAVPAFLALMLYALLPIVRNTHAGLTQVAGGVVEAATALGLRPVQTLGLVELPLAAPLILAGVRTSAVINVGTATIAAFIGAGGFGERIVTGLALNDHATLLAGAIPVAALAVLIEWGFGRAERWFVPAGLRAAQASRKQQ